MSTTTDAPTTDGRSTDAASTAGTVTRLLQRQILPLDRDTDVFRLYVDPEPAVLDADKYEVGSSRAAQDGGLCCSRPPAPARAAAASRPRWHRGGW